MSTREVIIPKGMEILYEKFHYCPGIKVGKTLYISGQVGRDENLRVVEGTEAQFVQTFENVKKVLSAAGATFDDVVEMITYHVTGAVFSNLQDQLSTASDQQQFTFQPPEGPRHSTSPRRDDVLGVGMNEKNLAKRKMRQPCIEDICGCRVWLAYADIFPSLTSQGQDLCCQQSYAALK